MRCTWCRAKRKAAKVMVLAGAMAFEFCSDSCLCQYTEWFKKGMDQDKVAYVRLRRAVRSARREGTAG